jgi:putative transposase
VSARRGCGSLPGRWFDHARFRCIWSDATYRHVRSDHQVTSKVVVVATGDGRREILGIDIGDSEDEAFWGEFLRALRRRGLSGVRLVISEQHPRLVAAIWRCLQGANHQRCRIPFARILLANIPRVGQHPKGHQEMVSAAFRTIFAQVSLEEISAQWVAWRPCSPSASTRPPR